MQLMMYPDTGIISAPSQHIDEPLFIQTQQSDLRSTKCARPSITWCPCQRCNGDQTSNQKWYKHNTVHHLHCTLKENSLNRVTIQFINFETFVSMFSETMEIPQEDHYPNYPLPNDNSYFNMFHSSFFDTRYSNADWNYELTVNGNGSYHGQILGTQNIWSYNPSQTYTHPQEWEAFNEAPMEWDGMFLGCAPGAISFHHPF